MRQAVLMRSLDRMEDYYILADFDDPRHRRPWLPGDDPLPPGTKPFRAAERVRLWATQNGRTWIPLPFTVLGGTIERLRGEIMSHIEGRDLDKHDVESFDGIKFINGRDLADLKMPC